MIQKQLDHSVIAGVEAGVAAEQHRRLLHVLRQPQIQREGNGFVSGSCQNGVVIAETDPDLQPVGLGRHTAESQRYGGVQQLLPTGGPLLRRDGTIREQGRQRTMDPVMLKIGGAHKDGLLCVRLISL